MGYKQCISKILNYVLTECYYHNVIVLNEQKKYRTKEISL